MNQRIDFRKIVFVLFLLVFLVIIFTLIVTVTSSKIEFESECNINHFSFDINETGSFKNVSLSDGEIKCNIKGKAPLIVVLGLK